MTIPTPAHLHQHFLHSTNYTPTSHTSTDQPTPALLTHTLLLTHYCSPTPLLTHTTAHTHHCSHSHHCSHTHTPLLTHTQYMATYISTDFLQDTWFEVHLLIKCPQSPTSLPSFQFHQPPKRIITSTHMRHVSGNAQEGMCVCYPLILWV